MNRFDAHWLEMGNADLAHELGVNLLAIHCVRGVNELTH